MSYELGVMSWCVGVGVFTAETQGPQGYAENVQRTPAYLDASSPA